MGHPKRSNDWYIAPTSAGAARSQSDEIPGVPVRLPKSGSVEFIDWLDRGGLVDEFDDHRYQQPLIACTATL